MEENRSKQGRILAFFASLGVLIVTIGTIGLMIQARPDPDIRAPSELQARAVNVLDLERGSHPVTVQAFGTARPAKTINFQAPISGTVSAASDLFVGKKIEAGHELFTINTIKQDLAINDLHVQINQLNIKKLRLSKESAILKERLETARELLENATSAITKQQELLGIEKQLFENSRELYADETISYNERLKDEQDLRKVELAVLQAETNRNNRKDALARLELSMDDNRRSIENIENEREALEIKIADLEDDRARARIVLDSNAQIVELFIEKQQEVTAGANLASVRTVAKSQVQVDIPDFYFRWLYSGSFLDQLGDGTASDLITIELVLQNFDKTFTGGYLKSIGDRVNIPTRSLPILIERENPLDDEGWAISKEELKPGMYCKVTLELAQVPNSFRIPYRAIQNNGSLLIAAYIEGQWTMQIIKDPVIVHEGVEGTIVTLPASYEKIRLITDQIRAVQVGAPLEPQLPEDDAE